MKKLATLALLSSVLVTFSGSLGAQSGRALTIEDYYKIKSVGDTQISPDGRWVAFTVTAKIEDDNTNAADTFVVPADGSASPRKITHDGRSVATPRWTADGLLQYSLNARGNSWVFLGGDAPQTRTRAESASFTIDVTNPSATPVAATATPAGVLSADGKWRAQARDLPRTPVSDAAATAFEKRHAARFKGRQFDWMRFQSDGQDYPTADPRTRPAAEIAITPVAGGDSKTITKLGMRASNVAWHPSGSTIAFTADEGWQNEQAYEQPDIYTVSTSGDVKRLTNDGYVWSSLAYSPDGQFLLSERTFGTGMIIEKHLSHGGSDDLIVWPANGGAQINLTASLDLEPNAPRWSPDSTFVYFTAEKGGTVHLFRVAARAGAAVEQVTKGDRRLGSVTFDKAMTRIAYTVGTYESPSDVWTANIDGTGEKKLTDLFADIRAEIGITKTERIAWKSTDGTESRAG